MKRALVGLSVLLLAGAAEARTRAGVTMPDSIKVGETDLVLNGMGLRLATIFNVKVYVAGLYMPQKNHGANDILSSNDHKRLVLHFLRSVDKDDLVEAFESGFEKNAGKSMAKLKTRVERLSNWMADVSPDDELVMTSIPGKGVEVTIKGKTRGIIAGDDFARVLLTIFLGPEPPNEELKSGLLGTR